MHDFIVGNEPNLNRFWLPQFNPDGTDAAAPAYEQLLATTYDALKAVRPHVDGLRRRARAARRRQAEHRPRHALADRVHHRPRRRLPGERTRSCRSWMRSRSTPTRRPRRRARTSRIRTARRSASPTTRKLVGLLGTAFDGTAQRGSTLPILYDEFGIETQIPAAKAPLYIGTEPATTKPVSEAMQAQYYLQAMQMTFCQPTVLGLHALPRPGRAGLSAWQSGEYYVDGTPKTSLLPVRRAAFSVRRGIVAACPGLQLTPKLKLAAGKPTKTAEPVTLTCSLDCTYAVRLDGRKTLTRHGRRRDRQEAAVPRRSAKGRHSLVGTATAALNAGPPGRAALTFRL